VLSGELGVSQAFLTRWYIGGGYTAVSEVVVFMVVAKYTSRTVHVSLAYPMENLLAVEKLCCR